MQHHCDDCNTSYFVPGQNQPLVVNGDCPECGGHLRPERDQPSPTKSDGDIRNMPYDKMDDPGGNPLQEGILGDWQNRRKRDESFASVKLPSTEYVTSTFQGTNIVPVTPSNQAIALPWLHTAEAEFEVKQVTEPGPHTVEVRSEGSNSPVIMQHEDPQILDEAKQRVEGRTAGPAAALVPEALGGLAEGAAGLMGGALKTLPIVNGAMGIANKITGGGGGGGGGGGTPPAPTPQMDQYGHVANDLKPGGGTPGEFPRDTDDPEHVDPSEKNDGDNKDWQKDLSVDDLGGSSEIDPNSQSFQKFLNLLPLVLQYAGSDDSGKDDPLIMSLHDSLDKEHPGYLDRADHGKAQDWVNKAHQKHHGAVPIGQSTCPHCGAVTDPSNPKCPQCGAVSGTTGPAESQAQQVQDINQQGQAQRPIANVPMGRQLDFIAAKNQAIEDWKLAAEHQGPHSPEQIAAVQQYLIDHDRTKEVPNVPIQPWQYAQELAEIAQAPDTPPSADESAQPAMPAQEEAPPEATMPMPGMQMPPGQASVTAADNIAGRCPKCKGHTTQILNGDDGTSRCHSCGHVYKTKGLIHDKTMEPFMAAGPMEAPGAGHDPAGGNVLGIPAADQEVPHDLRHNEDSSHTWQTSDGQPVVEDQEYELYTPGVDIPDIVRIKKIKPDSLELEFVGAYKLNFRKEVTREEFNLEGYQLVPTDGDQDQAPAPEGSLNPDGDPETNNDDNTGFTGPGTGDLSSPHMVTTSWHPTDWHAPSEPFVSKEASTWLGQEQEVTASSKAQGWLEKTGGARFSPQEQREFIDEKGSARNHSKLDLSNTHYENSVKSISPDDFMFGW